MVLPRYTGRYPAPSTWYVFAIYTLLQRLFLHFRLALRCHCRSLCVCHLSDGKWSMKACPEFSRFSTTSTGLSTVLSRFHTASTGLYTVSSRFRFNAASTGLCAVFSRLDAASTGRYSVFRYLILRVLGALSILDVAILLYISLFFHSCKLSGVRTMFRFRVPCVWHCMAKSPYIQQYYSSIYVLYLVFAMCDRNMYIYTRASLHGRLTPPATLVQGRTQLNVKGADISGP